MRHYFFVLLAAIIIAGVPLSQAVADPPSIILYCNHWNNVCYQDSDTGCYLWCGDLRWWCEDSEWTAWHDDWFCQANEDPCEGAGEGDTCIPSYRRDMYYNFYCNCHEQAPVCEAPEGWDSGPWTVVGDWETCYVCP